MLCKCWRKYDSHSSSESNRKVFNLLRNRNFWKAAIEYEELLLPFAETIHHLERDMPLVSQLPRLWDKSGTRLTEWNRKYRILGEFLSDPVYTMPEGVEAAPVEKLSDALTLRCKKAWHPSFNLAMLLDLRFMVEDGGRFKPDMTLVGDQDAVVEELRRLAGEDADMAELEFCDSLVEGSGESMIKVVLNESTKIKEGWKMVAGVKRVQVVWKVKLKTATRKKVRLLRAIRRICKRASACSA